MANSVLAKMAVQISANTAEFNKAIKGIEGQLTGFGKTVSGIQTKLMGFAAGFSALQIGKQVIASFADFQFEMSKVQAVTQANAQDFLKLRNNAIELGKTYGVTSTQAATLQLELARLGFTTKEILDTTKSVVLLAKATGEDLAMAASTTGSVIRSFNLDASESGRVTDVMAAAFNKSALSLSDFTEAIKYVAPVAASAGLSLEQTSAMLGVLADNGIKGSMAGTSLRKIISDLGKGAAPELTKALAEMASKGLSGADAMDEVGRTAYASLLILSKNTGKINEATEAYKNSNGELQKMSDIMTNNLIGDWDKLTDAVDAFIQKAGEAKDSELREWLQEIAGGINILSDETLSTQQKALILMSSNWREVWDKIKKENEQAQSDISRQNNFFAQTFINDFGGIQAAIDAVSDDIAVFGKNKTWFGGLITSGQLLDTLNERLAKSNEEVARGLKSEADSANQTAKAYDFLAGRIAKMWMAKNASTNNPFLGEQITPVTGISVPKSQTPGSLPDKFEPDAAFRKQLDANDAYIKGLDAQAQQVKSIMVDMTSVVSGAFSKLGQDLGHALSGTANFGDSFLKAVGDFAVQFGEILIGIGTAQLALKTSFENPYVAIAAGIALVALGTVLSDLQSNSPVFSGGNGGGGVQRNQSISNTQSSITIDGRLYAEGSELVAVINSAQQSNYIRKG